MRRLQVWFEREPARLERELDDFRARGVRPELDEQELSKRRRIVVRLSWPIDGVTTELIVVYPDTFPHLRPLVYAHDLPLERHKNPYDGNLCLLDRSTGAWSSWWTAAFMIEAQLPLIRYVQSAPLETRSELEIAQGEPLTEFFAPQRGSAVFVPAAIERGLMQAGSETRGRFTIVAPTGQRLVPILRGLLRELRALSEGSAIATAEAELVERFTGAQVDGRWIRLTKAPRTNHAPELRAELSAADGWLRQEAFHTIGEWKIEIVGCVFSVETRQDVFEDGWLFVVSLRGTGRKKAQGGHYLVRGERLSESDLMERVPSVKFLRGKSVGLVGAGALGAQIALELAMCQTGTLRVLDHDLVELGNSVRWPFGVRAAGMHKATLLTDSMRGDHPFVDVVALDCLIGQAPLDPPDDEHRDVTALSKLFDGIDLVIDAAAEFGVSHLLADFARELEIPVVSVWSTEGAWGGGVARFTPSKTGCWYCLMHLFEDQPKLMPPFDRAAGTVQPRGCATRTFTGSRFDLLPLVAQATRLAVQTLSTGGEYDYPDDRDDLFILRLRDENGLSIAPAWESLKLEVHPLCGYCAQPSV